MITQSNTFFAVSFMHGSRRWHRGGLAPGRQCIHLARTGTRGLGFTHGHATEVCTQAAQIIVKTDSLEQLDQKGAAWLEPLPTEIQRQLGQGHRPDLVGQRHTTHIGGQIAQYKIQPMPPSRASSSRRTDSSRKSPCRKSTPAMLCIGRISSANTLPLSPSRLRTSCDQLPGAAPRSTTLMPGFSSRSRSISSSSLYTARERRPSAWAFLTYSSLKCSRSQTALLLLRAMWWE